MQCPATDEEALKKICELVKEDRIDEAIEYCHWAINWCGRGLHAVDYDLYFLKHNLGVSKEYFLSKWCKQFMPKPTPQPQKPTKPEKPKERPFEILDNYVEWYIVTENMKLRDITIEPNNEPVRIPKNAKMTVYAKLKQPIDESEVVARVSFDGQPTGIAKSYYGSTVHEYIEIPLSVAEYNHSMTFEVQKIDTQREEGGWIGWYPIKEGKHSIRLDIYSKPSGYPYGTETPYPASTYTKHIGCTSPILVDINGEVKRFVPGSPLRKAPYKGYDIIIKKLSGNRYKVLVPAMSHEGNVLKYETIILVDNSKGLTDEEIERSGGEFLEYGTYTAEVKNIKINGWTWGYEFEITVPEDAIDPIIIGPGSGFFTYKKIREAEEEAKISFKVKVLDENKAPIFGASVTVFADNVLIGSMTTDENGETDWFEVYEGSNVKIKARAEGYELAEKDFIATKDINENIIEITLRRVVTIIIRTEPTGANIYIDKKI